MDFSGLTNDEVYYELMLRGEQRKDFSLRQAIRRLQVIADKPMVDLVLNSEGELALCQAKLSELTQLVNDFSGTESDPRLDALDSRLAHLRRRTLRITDKSLAAATKNLSAAIIALDEALAIRVLDNARPTRGNVPATPMTTAGSPRTIPVAKWNLSFDGRSPLHEFLERAEELRLSNRISKPDLFTSASELFRDTALDWFRIEKDSIADWDALIERLKNEYHPKDYDHNLKMEILQRKQGPFERPGDFITAMRRLYSHLDNPVPVEEQLYTIRSNLQPRYADHAAAVNIQNFDELKQLCMRLSLCDVSKPSSSTSRFNNGTHSRHPSRLESFRSTREPSPTRSVSPGGSSRSVHELSRSPSPARSTNSDRKTRQSSSRRVSFSTDPTCWNCRQVGHRFHDCEAPWTRFCYRCGSPDVITPNCPKCRRASGNARSEP